MLYNAHRCVLSETARNLGIGPDSGSEDECLPRTNPPGNSLTDVRMCGSTDVSTVSGDHRVAPGGPSARRDEAASLGESGPTAEFEVAPPARPRPGVRPVGPAQRRRAEPPSRALEPARSVRPGGPRDPPVEGPEPVRVLGPSSLDRRDGGLPPVLRNDASASRFNSAGLDRAVREEGRSVAAGPLGAEGVRAARTEGAGAAPFSSFQTPDCFETARCGLGCVRGPRQRASAPVPPRGGHGRRTVRTPADVGPTGAVPTDLGGTYRANRRGGSIRSSPAGPSLSRCCERGGDSVPFPPEPVPSPLRNDRAPRRGIEAPSGRVCSRVRFPRAVHPREGSRLAGYGRVGRLATPDHATVPVRQSHLRSGSHGARLRFPVPVRSVRAPRGPPVRSVRAVDPARRPTHRSDRPVARPEEEEAPDQERAR